MEFPACLISRQHHISALAALGITTENLSFPATVNCPRCYQNSLYVFDDQVTGGIWFYCNGCLAHGDIIAFSASIWNTSVEDAVNKYLNQGLINKGEKDNIAVEHEAWLRRYREIEDFWFDAEAQIWNHGDDVIACRVRELGVNHEYAADGLVGVAYSEQVEKFCKLVGRPVPKLTRNRGSSIVFPYYDLPGRITGFLLTQYDDEFKPKQNFVPINGHKRRRPEAGYFLLKTALLPPKPELKNTQFIVDDPLWALTLQCEMLRHGKSLLPLMASYSGSEANSYGHNWSAFPTTPRIFQGQTASPELLSRAAAARGYVTIISPTRKLKTRLATAAMSRLVAIRTNLDTWPNVLYDTLVNMNEIAAHSFATRLTILPDKLAPCLKKIGERFSTGFADRVLSRVNAIPAATMPRNSWRWIITPKTDGWWTSANRQVCSANVVINRVVQFDDGNKTYGGVIYTDGVEIPFYDDATKIERLGLLKYAATIAAAQNRFVAFDSSWNKRSHLISIALNNPEFIGVSTKIGWDERADTFKFANYAIRNDGIVVHAAVPTNDATFAFPEPVAVAPPAIRRFLTSSPENAFVWSVIAAAISNLIRPILRKDSVATAISGSKFDVATAIGAVLSCPHIKTTSLRRPDVSRQTYDGTASLEWPTFVSNTFDDTSLGPIVPRCHNRPIIARLDSTAAVSALSYNWQVITGHAPHNDDFSVLRYILPTYIKRAMQNRMVVCTHDNVMHAVLEDLNRWLVETYGAGFQLDYAKNHSHSATDADTALAAELRHALAVNKLTVLPQPRKTAQSANYLLRKKDNWWLNQRAIENYFYSCKALPPNWVAIVDLFTQKNVFRGYEDIKQLPGILVDSDWCDTYLLADINVARGTG